MDLVLEKPYCIIVLTFFTPIIRLKRSKSAPLNLRLDFIRKMVLYYGKSIKIIGLKALIYMIWSIQENRQMTECWSGNMLKNRLLLSGLMTPSFP